MRKYRWYSAIPAILTLFLAVQCMMRFKAQSGSVVFYIWVVLPLCLLLLSYIAFFFKRWRYTVPVVCVAMAGIFVAAGGGVALGAILLLWVLLYYCSCMIHQKAKELWCK